MNAHAMAAPDSRVLYPSPGARITIDGPQGVPLRWWCVHNLSLASVEVFGGERAAGQPLASVPPACSMALPMQERGAVTFAIPETAPPPTAGQQVIVAADAAHQAAMFALNTTSPVASVLTAGAATIGSLALPAIQEGTYSLTTTSAGPFYIYVSSSFGAYPSKALRHVFAVDNGTNETVTATFDPCAYALGDGVDGQPNAIQIQVPAGDIWSVGAADSADCVGPWLDWLVGLSWSTAPSSGTVTVKYRGSAM